MKHHIAKHLHKNNYVTQAAGKVVYWCSRMWFRFHFNAWHPLLWFIQCGTCPKLQIRINSFQKFYKTCLIYCLCFPVTWIALGSYDKLLLWFHRLLQMITSTLNVLLQVFHYHLLRFIGCYTHKFYYVLIMRSLFCCCSFILSLRRLQLLFGNFCCGFNY